MVPSLRILSCISSFSESDRCTHDVEFLHSTNYGFFRWLYAGPKRFKNSQTYWKIYGNTLDDTCLRTTLIGDSLMTKTTYISVQLTCRNEIYLQLNFTTQDSVYKVILTRRYCHCFCVPEIVPEMIVIGRFLLFEQVYILMKKEHLIIIHSVIIKQRFQWCILCIEWKSSGLQKWSNEVGCVVLYECIWAAIHMHLQTMCAMFIWQVHFLHFESKCCKECLKSLFS